MLSQNQSRLGEMGFADCLIWHSGIGCPDPFAASDRILGDVPLGLATWAEANAGSMSLQAYTV
jgi:hypothetical protein